MEAGSIRDQTLTCYDGCSLFEKARSLFYLDFSLRSRQNQLAGFLLTPATDNQQRTSYPPYNGVGVLLFILIQTWSRLHTPLQGGEEDWE